MAEVGAPIAPTVLEPAAAAAPEEVHPTQEVHPANANEVPRLGFEKRLLEAECNSLRSALLEEQKEVDPVVIHTPDLQAEDPVLEQLKTLGSLQNVMHANLVEQQRNLRVSILQGRIAETVMKIQSKSIQGMELERKHLLAYVEKRSMLVKALWTA